MVMITEKDATRLVEALLDAYRLKNAIDDVDASDEIVELCDDICDALYGFTTSLLSNEPQTFVGCAV